MSVSSLPATPSFSRFPTGSQLPSSGSSSRLSHSITVTPQVHAPVAPTVLAALAVVHLPPPPLVPFQAQVRAIDTNRDPEECGCTWKSCLIITAVSVGIVLICVFAGLYGNKE